MGCTLRGARLAEYSKRYEDELRDITNVVSSENVNIHSLTSEEDEKTNACTVSLTVYTTGVEQLSRLFSRVESIPGVGSVFRVAETQNPREKQPVKPRTPRNSRP